MYYENIYRSNTFYAQNPALEILHPEREGLCMYTCITGMFGRTLYAKHPVSLRIFPSLPDSRPRLFVAMQIHLSLYSIFYQESVKVYPTHNTCSVEKQYGIVPGVFMQLV